jgi:restriction endonuclease S subunit
MWSATVPFAQLQKRARWKVEFFCGDSLSKPETAYESLPLRELFEERRESLDPQAYPDHMFNYLGLEHVQSLTGDLLDFRPRAGREILSRCKVFRKGDVLYGRLRPYLNKVFLACREVSEGICSGEFYVLTPERTMVLPDFARTILASKYVQRVVGGLLTGSALPRLQLQDLLAVEVPVPPIARQRLIEEFIVREEKLRRELAAKLADWPSATIEAVVSSLESGKKPTKLLRQHKREGVEQFANPLPPGQFCSGKARRGAEGGQALLKFS